MSANLLLFGECVWFFVKPKFNAKLERALILELQKVGISREKVICLLRSKKLHFEESFLIQKLGHQSYNKV